MKFAEDFELGVLKNDVSSTTVSFDLHANEAEVISSNKRGFVLGSVSSDCPPLQARSFYGLHGSFTALTTPVVQLRIDLNR